jgi:hypothetical protein
VFEDVPEGTENLSLPLVSTLRTVFFFLLKKVKKRPSRENSGIILRKSPTVYIHVSPEE